MDGASTHPLHLSKALLDAVVLTKNPDFLSLIGRTQRMRSAFTDEVYTNVDPVWLREQVNRMSLGLNPLLPEPRVDRMWTESGSD